jgi:hypothetical protein
LKIEQINHSNMNKKNVLFFLIGLILFGASCASPDSSSSSDLAQGVSASEDTAINFELTLNGLFTGSIENNAHQSQVQAFQTESTNLSENNLDLAIINYFSGQLIIANQNDPADVKTYPVTVAVNTETLEINLLQTIVLKPGTFMFELSINRAGQQYAGVVVSDISDTNVGAINTIDMDLKPIIGDSLISTDIVEDLGNLSFQYSDITNLKEASDDIIEIGVVIDSTSDEAIFRFDDTGTSEAYLNLFAEPDKIELKLYKNGAQIGKSKSAQETQSFNFGQDINMDLVPLFGRTLIALPSDGGDATFDVEFPSEIVSNGSITADNLEVYFTFNGILNGTQSQNINGTAFTLDVTNDLYSGGSFNLSGVQYDNLNVYLAYKKIDTDELIGACNFQINLNSTTQHSAICNISIQNSIIQSGNMMALANISVYSPALTPGATIYVIKDGGEEQILGITDANGYIETYLKSGSYQIGSRLPSNGRFGETSIILDPMEVANVNVTLNASAPINSSILINSGKTATYSKYVTLNLAAEDEDSIIAYYASESNTVPDENAPGWSVISDASADYQGSYPYQLSDGDGTKTVYVWFKNPSNFISPVAQDSIIVQKDSGIYLSNFAVTTNTYADSADLDLSCQNEFGNNYRLADWNDIVAFVGSSQTNALNMATQLGLPTTSTSYEVDNKRLLSFNDNRYSDTANTKHYYISRLNLSAEIPVPKNTWGVLLDSLYAPHGEMPINATDDLLLIPETNKTVQIKANGDSVTITEIQNITAQVACFGETGNHPLLNGTFDDPVDNFKFWGHVSGTVSVLGNELVLENEVSYSSMAIQDKIGVVDNVTYRLSADLKTSDTTILTVQVLDDEGAILAVMQSESNSWATEFVDFSVDVGSGDMLPLNVIVFIPANSTGNGFADNISLIRQ